MPAYIDRVRHVTRDEPVNAGVAARATSDLESNVRWLREVLDAAQLGQGLIARDQPVNPEAGVGQPVYWDADENRFELALARADVTDGVIQQHESARYVGLIHRKLHANVADIAILGLFDLDIALATGENPEIGVYYLSGMQPGALVAQRQPVTIPVCHYLGANKVILTAPWRNFVDDHTHYSFNLHAAPAGDHTPPTENDPHAITNADADLPGWLPANDAIFDGNAPAGAAFGYNLTAHDALWRVWPPIPLTAARIVWDKGADLVGGTEVPLGEDGLVVIDSHGIWWMSDGYHDVPWPDWTFVAGETTDEPSGDPRAEYMRIIFDFGRMGFATSNTAVTRLATDSPFLEIVNCDDEPANTGDLLIRLLLNILQSDDGIIGHQVVKQFDPDTLELQRGPVVEGLLQGAAVTLTSATTRKLDPEDAGSADVYQGLVEINHDADATGREFSWEVIRSDEMRQRYDGNVIYVAFPTGHASGLRAKVFVPPVGLPATVDVVVRLTLLGTAADTLPTLTCTYRRIPRVTTPTTVPSGETACTLPAMPTVAANQYVEIETDPFEIEAGDTLFISLVREVDDYIGEVGILRATIALV